MLISRHNRVKAWLENIADDVDKINNIFSSNLICRLLLYLTICNLTFSFIREKIILTIYLDFKLPNIFYMINLNQSN